MSLSISQQSQLVRFDHLLKVISSQRFLEMRGLNNDLPFYICEFKPADVIDMQRQQSHLIKTLAGLSIECLGGRGVQVLDINLYDLCIHLLKNREGANLGACLWQDILAIESEVDKDSLLELLQNVLSVEDYIIPAIAERMNAEEYDVLFLSGIGEVFPYIRSHNILNNLQSTAKHKPTVLFFPGEYRHSLEQGASLELFGLLHDDKYYRAFNIFES